MENTRKFEGVARKYVLYISFLVMLAILLTAKVSAADMGQKYLDVSAAAQAVEETLAQNVDTAQETTAQIQHMYAMKTIEASVYAVPRTQGMDTAAELASAFDAQVSEVVAKNKQEEQERLERERQAKLDKEYLAGSGGRVIIPNVGLNMRLTGSSLDDPGIQGLMDAGGAVGFSYNGSYVIGGHQNLGFSRIRSCVPGKTVAYINGRKYICSSLFAGRNNDTSLTDMAGNPVSCSGIVMYTCNGADYHNVTISYWRQV